VVTWGEWAKAVTLFGILDLGSGPGRLLNGQDSQSTGITSKLLNDFVSSIVGRETNISLDHLPSVPGPAAGVASTQADKLSKKADDLISGSLKRSPSYRSDLAQKTYREILQMAKKRGAEGKAARGMKKLIEQGERLRGKGKGK